MNILKANRAINPSKINLSEEMLHFYFRAQSRPRHGLRPRSAPRAVPREGRTRVGAAPARRSVSGTRPRASPRAL